MSFFAGAHSGILSEGRRGEKIERRGDESQIEKSVVAVFQTAVQSPLPSKSR